MTPETETRYLDGSPWTGASTVVVFVSWLIGGIVGGVIAGLAGEDPRVSATGLAIVIAAQSVAAFIAIVAYSRGAGTGSLRTDIGFTVRPRHWYGILLGFALQWGVGLVLLPVIEALGIESEPQAVSDVASSTGDASGRLLLFLSFVVAAPIAEELLFRGVLLGWLAKRMNRSLAVVVSGVLFGLVHWEGPDVLVPILGLVLIGIALGYAATRYGNLSMAIMLHAGVNLIAFLVLVFEDRILEWIEEAESSVNAILHLVGS